MLAASRGTDGSNPVPSGGESGELPYYFGLGHAARSDDLQILLVPVEVRGDFEPDAIRIKK